MARHMLEKWNKTPHAKGEVHDDSDHDEKTKITTINIVIVIMTMVVYSTKPIARAE